MGRFKNIDLKLFQLAQKLNAVLTKDRPEYPEVLRTFEERRIDWHDGPILKAIIIQPTFENTAVNSTIWNFINIAIFDDGHSVERPKMIKILMDKVKFKAIEKNIDSLLSESEVTLTNIAINDLK